MSQTDLTIASAQARLDAAFGDRAPRVTEVSGDSYKIAGRTIWHCFPTPPRPLRRETDVDAHLQSDNPPRTPPRGERDEGFDERPTWEDR